MIFRTKFTLLKKVLPAFLIFFSLLSVITIQSCRKKRTELATVLFKKTHNKVFRDLTPEGFSEAFKALLEKEKPKIPNAEIIRLYYDQNDYEPVYVLDHLFNDDLLSAANYFQHADAHGLNVQEFQGDTLKLLISKFHSKDAIKTLKEAYQDMAKIELITANSLLVYSKQLQYGVVDPKKIFQRYYLDTQKPDSIASLRIFNLKNIKSYLDSIQPRDTQYVALQKALVSGVQAPGLSAEETKRILIVNLERLRWKNKPTQQKYVIVNIPDFTLNVIDSGHSVLNMKVCVGEGRNLANQNTVLSYNDTAKVDKPFPRETPLLNSMIYCVDVNPVWNIPNSIATKEIIVDAAKDRYYLSNKNIEVYKFGKLIKDPESIDWSKVTKQNSDYEFKQKPGADNALGKIKFLFKNKSDVYLHDTPAKFAFTKTMRSVSHGCVRLGSPEALALNLFGNTPKYKLIEKDMSLDKPEPTTIYLPKKIPVYLQYYTCWDDKGILQFRQDVYGLDVVLYDQLKNQKTI